ncbi:MAG: hypothetical protein ACHQJ4_08035, partial [Ignavibacteria bacterium]
YLYLLFIISTVFLASCRDYEYVPYQPPGTRSILIYSNDSLAINKDSTGNYINQDYYETISNFMDSIRIDFSGATNIDTGNFSSIVVQADDLSNNNVIKTYTFNTPDSINRNYNIGFKVAGISGFIVYFNLNLIINYIQSGGAYLRMKNIRVYNIY